MLNKRSAGPEVSMALAKAGGTHMSCEVFSTAGLTRASDKSGGVGEGFRLLASSWKCLPHKGHQR